MARREIIYKFDGVSVGWFSISGEANVEYSAAGSWEVALVYIESAYDQNGDPFDWVLAGRPPVKDALTSSCAVAIQSAVDEAIYRRDG